MTRAVAYGRFGAFALALSGALACAGPACAQEADLPGGDPTAAQEAYEQPAQEPTAYQQQPYEQQQAAAGRARPGRSGRFRQLFAGTVAAVLQGVGTTVAMGLAQAVSGTILSWFKLPPPADQMATQPYPAAAPGDPSQYGGQPYGPQPQPDPYAYEQPAGAASVDPAYDESTGSTGAYPPDYEGVPGAGPLYAGLAFEVHLLDASGSSLPVDAASHVFLSGDRFVVYYRPTLPGRMSVYNVNPRGEERRIDSLDVAAGQLARLGPYEFRDTKGDEVLRLVLWPCRSDALITATRDIVRVEASAEARPLSLPECSGLGARGLRPRARDIAKVEVEGSTNFALDPIPAQELASGAIAAREVSIVLQHR